MSINTNGHGKKHSIAASTNNGHQSQLVTPITVNNPYFSSRSQNIPFEILKNLEKIQEHVNQSKPATIEQEKCEPEFDNTVTNWSPIRRRSSSKLQNAPKTFVRKMDFAPEIRNNFEEIQKNANRPKVVTLEARKGKSNVDNTITNWFPIRRRSASNLTAAFNNSFGKQSVDEPEKSERKALIISTFVSPNF